MKNSLYYFLVVYGILNKNRYLVITMEEKKKKVVDKAVAEKESKSKKRELKGSRKKKKLTQADIKKYSMTELDHVILKIKANEVKYTVISVVIILVVFFIISFMAFSSVQSKDKYNILKDGDLFIEFKEKENGLGDVIDLVDVSKFSDSNMVLDTYRVTITNDSDETRKFEILIKDDLDMIAIDDCRDIFLQRSFLRYNINGGEMMSLGEDDRIIFGTLKGDAKVTYDIKVWVSDTYDGNPHYHGKIVVKQIMDKEKDS